MSSGTGIGGYQSFAFEQNRSADTNERLVSNFSPFLTRQFCPKFGCQERLILLFGQLAGSPAWRDGT